MTTASDPASMAAPVDSGVAEQGVPGGDVYTMFEAARLKGVSYHTVSRAVRRGKLPAQRLGRMALITAEDLRAWRPMRERAPRKYRRREPNPNAAPALLDLASGQRVELARQLSTFYELLHGAATELPLADFLALVCDRLASALDFRRVAIWGVYPGDPRAVRLATFGPRFRELTAEIVLAETPIFAGWLDLDEAVVEPKVEGLRPKPGTGRGSTITSLFVAPLRVGRDRLGLVTADRAGEPFDLSDDQLWMAQAMANQAALAIEQARLRGAEAARADELATILETLSEAVYACDAEGRVTVCNAAARHLLNIDPGTVAAHGDIRDILARQTRHTLDGQPIPVERTPIIRALAGERVRETRFRLIPGTNGQELTVSGSAVPLVRGGRVVGAVAVTRNVTDELAVAQRDAARLGQLETSAARAAAVAEVGSAINRGDDLHASLQRAITLLTEMLGGMSGSIFFRGDSSVQGAVGYNVTGPSIESLNIDMAALPTTQEAARRQGPLFMPAAAATPSERKYFDLYGFQAAIIAPLLVAGELIGVAYVNYAEADRVAGPDDLAFASAMANQCAAALEKQRLLEQIEAGRRQLRALIDVLPQGVLLFADAEGEVIAANRAAHRLWGLEPGSEAAPSGEYTRRMHDAFGDPFRGGQTPLVRVFTQAEPLSRERLTLRRDDDRTVEIVASHAPIVDDAGEIIGAVGIYEESDPATALDRAKDEFLSVLAHEIRNPLTSLRGNLQLLQRRIRQDESRAVDAERLENVLHQTDRMATLVNRLFELSRADLDQFDLSLEPVDAVPLVERAVENGRGLFGRKGISLQAPESLPVVWDEERIEQVIANLLSNAAKYAPGSKIEVELRQADDDRVEIAVRDHGTGVPDEMKSRIFDRYVRTRESGGGAPETGEQEGLGLGLYISRQIVQAHGGELTVEDASGGGARFVIRLPRDATPFAATR